jgi:3-isopropylmalate dehydratase small subunit
VFGDNIDTDAILPGEYLHLNDMDELGRVCFEHTNPDFRQKVADGYNIGMWSPTYSSYPRS